MNTTEIERAGIQKHQGQTDWRHHDLQWRYRDRYGEWIYRGTKPVNVLAAWRHSQK